jgi:hypothetical protein
LGRLSCQFVEQRLCVNQIGRIDAFSEPTMHRRQQVVSISALSLALPQFGEAGGGAEFPGFGLLGAGNSKSLLEAGFGFSVIVFGQSQQ